jgi:hypothetical protein
MFFSRAYMIFLFVFNNNLIVNKMEELFFILSNAVNTFIGTVTVFFASVSDGSNLFVSGSEIALSLAITAFIPSEVLANIRRWHGSVDEQYGNIDSLVNDVDAHAAVWAMPDALHKQLKDSRDSLSSLIPKCRSSYGSAADRAVRNSLLKSTVGLCLTQVRSWVYMEYYAGAMTVDDVHVLGFFLPGESGGHQDRKEETDVLAEVKVKIINEDFIRAVVDQATGENPALVVHGWPPGIRHALIVIKEVDGMTEVYRQLTTRLHNDIQMPAGSHGKRFMIRAAFLRHVDDTPRFGPEPLFAMPLSPEELIATLDHQHHEEFEAQIHAVEQHRKEVEGLQRQQ